MELSPIVDTIISLAFIYIVFSLLASFILELFAESQNLRGKLLYQKLGELFNDPTGNNPNIGHLLYKHPSVKAMVYKKNRVPEKITPDQFATVLNDVLKEITFTNPSHPVAYDDSETKSLGREEMHQPQTTYSSFNNTTIAYLYRSAYGSMTTRGEETFNMVGEQYRAVFEEWFEGLSAQLSYIYKRKTRLRLFFIGLILAVVLRCDSIHLLQSIYNDSAMRSQLSQTAMQMSDSITGAALEQEYVEEIMLTMGDERSYDALSSAEKAKILYRYTTGLPISRQWPETGMDHIADWILAVLGFAITAAAVIFGAPFWFDVLRKLIAIRPLIAKSSK